MAGKGHKFLRRGDQVDAFNLADKDWALEAAALLADGGARADVYLVVRDAGRGLRLTEVAHRLRAKWPVSTVGARLAELAYPGRYTVRGAGLLTTDLRDGTTYYTARPWAVAAVP